MKNKIYRCSGCDLDVETTDYFDIEIRPKEGVCESSLDSMWCDLCENETKWFLGKGVPWKKGEQSMYEFEKRVTDRNLIKLEEEINKINKNISKLKDKVNNSSFYNFFYSSRLQTLEYLLESKTTEYHKSKKDVEKYMDNFSIDYWSKFKSTPKCIHCGNQSVNKDLIHSCGGNLYYEIINSDLHINYGLHQPNTKIEYDANGDSITHKMVKQ